MWFRRRWVIIAVVAISVVLVAGIIGGVVYAQTTTPTPDAQAKTLLARVAAILGIDQQKVEDAFNQAQKEMKDEALANRLDKLVESGEITQEQADQYKAWQESRPDVPAIVDGKGPKDFRGGPGPGFRGGPGFPGNRLPSLPGKFGQLPAATQ